MVFSWDLSAKDTFILLACFFSVVIGSCIVIYLMCRGRIIIYQEPEEEELLQYGPY